MRPRLMSGLGAMMAAAVMVGLLLSPVPTFSNGVRPAVVAGRAVLAAGTQPFVPIHTPTPTRTPTPISIGNFVWDDRDHDGRQDTGEPGLAGVTVQLWNSTKTVLIDSTLTNASGLYTVHAPAAGNYRIRVVLPGFLDYFSPKDQAGGDDQLDSDINPTGTSLGFTDIFNLTSNIISTTIYDAGIVVYRPPTPTRTPTPISIGNLVWHDLNGDGVQTAGEPGVAAVTVQLWNEAITVMLDTTITNASGIYQLRAPTPGTYRVRVVLAQGGSFTLRDQGDDSLDSDIYTSGFGVGFTAPLELPSNLISTTTIDAGLINLPTVTATPNLSERIYVPHVER
jgi:hypothetical protein